MVIGFPFVFSLRRPICFANTLGCFFCLLLRATCRDAGRYTYSVPASRVLERARSHTRRTAAEAFWLAALPLPHSERQCSSSNINLTALHGVEGWYLGSTSLSDQSPTHLPAGANV